MEMQRQQQAAQLEAERQQRQQQTAQFEAELEVRKAEIRLQEQRANEELALHKQELARQRARDDQQSERDFFGISDQTLR